MENKELETKRHSCRACNGSGRAAVVPTAPSWASAPPWKTAFITILTVPTLSRPRDLKTIETKMKELIKARIPFECKPMSKAEAKELLKNAAKPISWNFWKNCRTAKLPFIPRGILWDLCRGPHVEHTGKINNFKLSSIAGAYWRGGRKAPHAATHLRPLL